MKKILFTAIALLVLLPIFASAATYYVDKASIGGTCNNNNAGTSITAPWCTIAKATATVISGDTVYIRAGIYTENDGSAVLRTHSSGTAGNYITFQNYNNEAVIMRNQPIGIYNNQNYIRFIGLRVENENRDTSIMIWGMRFDGGNHVIVQGCTAYNLKKQPDGSRGIVTGPQASYYQILNNTVMYVGQTEAEGDDMGECVWIDGTHNLVQGNTLRFGGHNTALIGGDYNILRDNIMDNTGWGRTMQTANPYENYRQLVEDNIIRNSGDHTDVNVPNPNIQLQSSNAIFRRNRVYNALGNGGDIVSMGDYESDNIHIYHNVFYNSGIDHDAEWSYGLSVSEHTDENLQNLDIRNNIFYANYKRDPVNDINLRIIWGHSLDPEDLTNVGNHWDNDGDPRFAAPGSGDFTLQSSSQCINTGTWLTITRSAGSGTSIPVNDASYFMDGWNIIEGDIIQLQGQTTTARITSINYDTNTITVNTSLTWSNGLGVALAYSGNAPDIGAYEYASGTPPLQCTEADWTHTDTACQPNNTLTRTWTKIGSCQGGVTHPATETISCTYNNPADLNNDGSVNIIDLSIVASDFGKTSSLNNQKSDTNNDGIVDIYDVVYVASRIS